MGAWNNPDLYRFDTPAETAAKTQEADSGLWSDVGKSFAAGANRAAATLDAGVRALTRSEDMRDIAAANQKAYNQSAEEWSASRSEQAQRVTSTPLLENSFGDAMYKLLLTGTESLPSMGMAVGAGVVGGPVGVSLAIGGQAAAEYTADVYDMFDNKTDAQLQEQLPQYAKLRETMDEATAREEIASETRGNMPLYIGLLSAGLGQLSAAGQISRAIRPGVSAEVRDGIIKRVAKGGAEALFAGGAQEGAQQLAAEDAAVYAQFKDAIDWGVVFDAAVTGGILEATFGAGAGMFHGRGGGGEETTRPEIVSDVSDEQREALGNSTSPRLDTGELPEAPETVDTAGTEGAPAAAEGAAGPIPQPDQNAAPEPPETVVPSGAATSPSGPPAPTATVAEPRAEVVAVAPPSGPPGRAAVDRLPPTDEGELPASQVRAIDAAERVQAGRVANDNRSSGARALQRAREEEQAVIAATGVVKEAVNKPEVTLKGRQAQREAASLADALTTALRTGKRMSVNKRLAAASPDVVRRAIEIAAEKDRAAGRPVRDYSAFVEGRAPAKETFTAPKDYVVENPKEAGEDFTTRDIELFDVLQRDDETRAAHTSAADQKADALNQTRAKGVWKTVSKTEQAALRDLDKPEGIVNVARRILNRAKKAKVNIPDHVFARQPDALVQLAELRDLVAQEKVTPEHLQEFVTRQILGPEETRRQRGIAQDRIARQPKQSKDFEKEGAAGPAVSRMDLAEQYAPKPEPKKTIEVGERKVEVVKKPSRKKPNLPVENKAAAPKPAPPKAAEVKAKAKPKKAAGATAKQRFDARRKVIAARDAGAISADKAAGLLARIGQKDKSGKYTAPLAAAELDAILNEAKGTPKAAPKAAAKPTPKAAPEPKRTLKVEPAGKFAGAAGASKRLLEIAQAINEQEVDTKYGMARNATVRAIKRMAEAIAAGDMVVLDRFMDKREPFPIHRYEPTHGTLELHRLAEEAFDIVDRIYSPVADDVTRVAYGEPTANRKRDVPEATSREALDKLGGVTMFAKDIQLGNLPADMVPYAQAMFQRLKSIVGDVPVRIIPDNVYQATFGDLDPYYLPVLDTIIVPQSITSRPDYAQSMLHELAHPAFTKALGLSPRFRSEMNRVAKELLAHYPALKEAYAYRSAEEFVSEMMSNPSLRELAAGTPASRSLAAVLGTNKSKLRTLWDAMIRSFGRMLGMKPKEMSLLDAAMRSTQNMEAAIAANPLKFTGPIDIDTLTAWTAKRAAELTHAGKPTTPVYALTGDGTSAARAQMGYELQMADVAKKVLTEAKNKAIDIGPRQRIIFGFASMDFLARTSDRFFGGADNNPIRKINELLERKHTYSKQVYNGDKATIRMIADAKKRATKEQWDSFVEMLLTENMTGLYADKALDQQDHLPNTARTYAWAKERHPELAAAYARTPQFLRDLRKRLSDYYTERDNAVNFATLKNRILHVTAADPNLTAAARDAMARRIFNGKETPQDIAMMGPEVYVALKEVAEYSKIKGPYTPLYREGDWRVEAKIKIAPPTGNGVVQRPGHNNQWDFTTEAAADSFAGRQNTRTTKAKVFVNNANGETWMDDNGTQRRVTAKDVAAGTATEKWRVTVQDRYVDFVGTKSEAAKLTEELAGSAGYYDARFLKRGDVNRSQYDDMAGTQVEALIKALEKREGFQALTASQQNELIKSLQESVIRFRAGGRAKNLRLPRQYVEGASRDLLGATNSYASASATYIAHLRYAPDLDAEYKRMADMTRKPDNSEYSKENVVTRSEYLAEMERRREYDTGTALPGSKLVKGILATSFAAKLASPAYSINNLSQVPMQTFPILAGRHGIGRSARALVQAYNEIGSASVIAKGVGDTVRKIGKGATTQYYDLIRARIRDPNTRRAMDEIVNMGGIDPDAGIEIGPLAETGPLSKVVHYVEEIARQAPRAIEAINRVTTAKAAFELEFKKTGDFDKSVRYAYDTVNRAQYNYSPSNAAPILRSNNPLAQFAFQFKKFGIHTYQMFGEQVGIAMNRDLPASDRAEAIKALALLSGTHALAAGAIAGIPFIELAKIPVMIAAMFGSGFEWEDVEAWMRDNAAAVLGDKMGEVVARGITRAVPGGFGFDVSGRLGLDSLLTYGEPDVYSREGVNSYVAEMIGGAPVDTIFDMYDMMGALAEGDVGKAAEGLPLKFISDTAKAINRYQKGTETRSGKQSSTPYSVQEAIVRSIGFTPSRNAEEQEARSRYVRETALDDEERKSIKDQWAAAASDAARTRMWITEIIPWNLRRPPEQRLSRQDLNASLKRKKTEAEKPTFLGRPVSNMNVPLVEDIERVYNLRR